MGVTCVFHERGVRAQGEAIGLQWIKRVGLLLKEYD